MKIKLWLPLFVILFIMLSASGESIISGPGYYGYEAGTDKCFVAFPSSENAINMLQSLPLGNLAGKCELSSKPPDEVCCLQICETYDESTSHCELKSECKDEVITGLVERTETLDAQIKNQAAYNFQITAALGAALILSICLNAYLIARKRKNAAKRKG
jgi:hypothetical protein